MRGDILEQAQEIRTSIDSVTGTMADADAAKNPMLFLPWKYPVQYYDGTDGEHPQSRVRGITSGFLYKCGKNHTSQADWPPESTPAIWTVIDESHAGTIDSPIPATRGMEYTYGLYYTDSEDGKLYLCQRTGEATGGTVVLQYMPHEIVGHYFVEVS